MTFNLMSTKASVQPDGPPCTAALDLHSSGRRLLHVGAGTAHGGVSWAPRAGLHHWLRLL